MKSMGLIILYQLLIILKEIVKLKLPTKTLLRILSRMVHEELKRWSDLLPLVLWAYRTSKRTSTQATPFSVVYGTESVVPVEITVPSTCLALASKILDPNSCIYDVEAFEKRRRSSKEK